MSSKIQRVLPPDMSLTPLFIAYRLLSGDNPFNIAMLEGSNIEATNRAVEIIIKLMPQRDEIQNELDKAIKMKAQLSLPAHLAAIIQMDEASLSKLMTIKFVTDKLEESETKNMIDAINNMEGETMVPDENNLEKSCDCCSMNRDDYGHELSQDDQYETEKLNELEEIMTAK